MLSTPEKKIKRKSMRLTLCTGQKCVYPQWISVVFRVILWTKLGNIYTSTVGLFSMNLETLFIQLTWTLLKLISFTLIANVQKKGVSTSKNSFLIQRTITFGNKLLVYGGFNGNRHLQDYHVFETNTVQWNTNEPCGQKPSPREKNSLVLFKNEALVLFGGYFWSEDTEAKYYYNDLYFLNLQSLFWLEIKTES